MILITDDMKTEWYPADTPPVHPGIYEVETVNGTVNVYYCYYGEGAWASCGRSEDEALARKDWTNMGYRRKWRGLKAPYDGETS